MRRHWLVEPLPEPELREIGQLAERALTLAPNLAEAHVALGAFHYYGFREYEPALAQFQGAIELQPNNSQALQFVAFVHRRQAKWDATVRELKKAMEQDPHATRVSWVTLPRLTAFSGNGKKPRTAPDRP